MAGGRNRSGQFQQRGDGISDELLDLRPPLPEEMRNVVCAAVTEPDPDDLGRGSLQDTESVDIFVLGYQQAPEIDRALLHDIVSRATEAKETDVDRIGREVLEVLQKGLGQLLVEEHPHG